MKTYTGLTGREICDLIEKNDLMDIPIWNPDDNIGYATLCFIVKDATDEDPSYHTVNVNVVDGNVNHIKGRVKG